MMRLLLRHLQACAGLACLFAVVACQPPPKENNAPIIEDGGLLRVGSIVITQTDLDHQLQEKHGGRKDEQTRGLALAELETQARSVQAALDAGLWEDPLVRAETARLLSNRLKEKVLSPRIKETIAGISEERLRAIYQSQLARYQSGEKRQVAVLWLNPGPNPERQEDYKAKMSLAREWVSNDNDLAGHPEKGFSVLAVDHSEHAATRFKGGLLGWIDADGGSTDWSRAVSAIAWPLKAPGEVSPVVVRPEGVFLVRLIALVPAVEQTFDQVRTTIEQEEKARLRQEMEDQFYKQLEAKYPNRKD